MTFSAEVIPPDCWIILYLQYLRSFFNTVNEGGPELPCMTVVIIIIIIILLKPLYTSQIIVYHYLCYVQPNKKKIVEQYENGKPYAK